MAFNARVPRISGRDPFPATFVGTAAGSATGLFDANGTFTSPGSSSRMHARGQAIFEDQCFGHIEYQQFAVLPDGTEVDIQLPLKIDFTVVNGGDEILGTANALGANATGNVFMSCRLVKIRNHD